MGGHLTNVPPGVRAITTRSAEERYFCVNAECEGFAQGYEVDIMYEHDTGAYYPLHPECPHCDHDGDPEFPVWLGLCSNPRCDLFNEHQAVVDETPEEAECADCGGPLTVLREDPE